ncbi:CapA family protein [Paenibacillus aceris]|uniref:Poly-gamma-glutamate synthesis protein (Capsule biosynthesis protein) n=1 Tax=Paenibacillus aceris TaxID=869555 RepID=A0ABS4I0P0_9BACL|nr:CapA family protein [Paenibacillus aceris]MBP1964380.1 poly-gamma-glutamate synthesis protein (capsule biosynthesis protein) [Paenibacillus aceris]NHW35904.1 CapA family protein [Paenibacillus aceris]
MSRKHVAMVTVIALMLLLSAGCFYSAKPSVPQEPTPQAKESQPPSAAIQPVPSILHTAPTEVKPRQYKVTLAAIGDVLIHSEVYQDAKQKDGTYHFSGMFESVQRYLREPDLLVANQETMIGGKELRLSGYPSFNSPHEVGDALKKAGVDLVTVANNHTLDRGEKVIQSALSYWDRLGIPYTGSFKSQEDQSQIRTLTKNNITFSFLSYSYGTNGIPHPKGKAYLINRIEVTQIENDVEIAKRISDVIVVAMHWGTEYESLPNENQKFLAQKLADLGVHIVIGNHPHVLQPPAWVTGKNGNKTLVLYSLGNFISAQGGLAKRVGGMAAIDVIKTTERENLAIALQHPAFLPTYTTYRKMTQFRVLPMRQVSEEQLNNGNFQYDQIQRHMRTYMQELRFIDTDK